MQRRTFFVTTLSACFVMLFGVTALQHETKTQPPQNSEWGIKILEATRSNTLEHIQKPDDWGWLTLWVELQSPDKRILLAKDILVIDDAGEKYQAAAMDCEVPKGDSPRFIVFSELQGRGPVPSSKKRGFWSPMIFTSKENPRVVSGRGLGCFYDRDPNKFILAVKKDDKDKEAGAQIEFGSKLKGNPKIVLLFMVMSKATSFELKIGDGPTIKVPLQTAATPAQRNCEDLAL